MDWIAGLFQNIVAHYLITKGVPALIAIVTAVRGKIGGWSWPLAVFYGSGIFAFLVLAFSQVIPPLQEPPVALTYFEQWNVSNTGFSSTVKTQPLVSFKKDYRLMVVCQWPDFTVDAVDDHKIQKSQLFEITGETISIRVPFSESFTTFAISPELSTKQLACILCLVPSRLTMDQIQNLRQLTDQGGKILQNAGMLVVLSEMIKKL